MAAQGDIADLQAEFPQETNNWIVPSAFLDRLLTTTNYVVQRKGIRIRHAIFTSDLDLQSAEINCDTCLCDCRFAQNVNFKESHFSRNLVLKGSHFAGVANFSGIKLNGLMSLESATFERDVLLNDSHIGGNLEAQNIHCLGSNDFTRAVIGGDLTMLGSTNEGIVDVRFAKIGGNLEIGAIFKDGFNAVHTIVRGLLGASNVQFTNPTAEVSFNAVQVDGLANFNNAIFSGPVDFKGARISDQFQASGSQFLNPTNVANFNSMTVGGHCFFGGATFSLSSG